MLRYITFILGLTLFLGSLTVSAFQDDASHRLYLEAKKRSFNQQWGQAAQLFEQLVADYPQSHYRAEAQFWVGYCLEKEGDYKEAYEALVALEKNFSNSVWLDDALQHKIYLAEKLADKRGDGYYLFLRQLLDDADLDIRYQAAMALARLGDRTALPALKALRGRVDFEEETDALIAQLEQSEDSPDEMFYSEDVMGEFEELTDRKPVMRINPKKDKVNYFPERRFEQYKSMTRKDDNWSPEDLTAFGLWHIMPTDEFDEYRSTSATERYDWLNRFWKQYDPTPTTDLNEGELEFQRRVRFARDEFNYFDGLQDFYYAPWDARGEVYIKFGKPDERTASDEGEFWKYSQYDNVTFFIRPHVTNIFGRAIFISSLNNSTMRAPSLRSEWKKWREFHNEYIFQPGFYYSLNIGTSEIHGFDLSLNASGPGLLFRYRMPTSELKVQSNNGLYQLSYLERYVIFNSQMNEVLRQETTRQITKTSKNEFERQKNIEQEIRVNLEPGDYTLGLRVEEPQTNKVAIRKQSFQVKY